LQTFLNLTYGDSHDVLTDSHCTCTIIKLS